MTTPPWWQTLVDTALLGTERRAIEPDVLPADLQFALTAASPERALLQTAAVAGNYLRAGTGPLPIALPDLPVCEPDTQPCAPKAALHVLAKIMDESTPNRRLLALWLSRCADRGWIIPPEKLPALLTLCQKTAYTNCHDNLPAVVGARGRWLRQFNTTWDYLVTPDPETRWHEGDSTDRAFALRQLRRADPVGARLLLQTDWPTETTKDRAKWMDILAETATLADEPFAGSVLAEVDAVKKPTAAHRSLRVQAVGLLLNVPGSALFQATQNALGQYVIIKRELLINKIKMLVLPEQPDAFFNEKTMTTYGFESNPELTGEQQMRHWMWQLLAVMHPSCWTTLFAVGYDQVVASLKRHPWFIREGIINFSSAIIRHRIAPAANELLTLVSGYQRAMLLALLPQPVREDRLIGTDELANHFDAYGYLTADGAGNWSIDFSQWVVQALARIVHQQYQLYPAQRLFMADAVVVIHQAIVRDRLVSERTASDPAGQTQGRLSVPGQLFDPLAYWLSIRQQINEL